jgi:RF-1 domain
MSNIPDKPITATQILIQEDDAILSACQFQTFRGPGPGGQKRNKTSSSVRLVHTPTGLWATAGEDRSQARNNSLALDRLKWEFALHLRGPIWLDGEFWTQAKQAGRFAAPSKSMAPLFAAHLLDVLHAKQYSLRDAAVAVGLSSSTISKFITDHPLLLGHVNTHRQTLGLRALVGGQRNGSRKS